MKTKLWYLVLFMFMVVPANGQVYFTNTVKDLALIPRDVKTNIGTALFDGNCSGNYNIFKCQTFQNGKLISSYSTNLKFTSGTAPFSYSIKLPAGKYHYQFNISFEGPDSFKQKILDVLVGDIYIIQGQSNAVANSYNGSIKPKYFDSFLRSFGSSTYDYTNCQNDTTWHFINGDGYYGPGRIGQWPTVIGKYLLDSFGIPIAFLNGAVGGTFVSQHQRYNPQPDNLNTIYGRLLYRMQKARITKNVRGILFFQGESDGQQGKVHDSLFRILYADWRKDYPNLQQNYFVQVRGGGCGSPTAAMLELQRQFEFSLSRLKVISSNGLNGHDGCHYWLTNGYEQLGLELAPLLARDLYNSKRKTNIDPPNIGNIFYNNELHTEIKLSMLQPLDSIFVDVGFEQLFSVTGDASVSIISGKVFKNNVLLTLNKGTCSTLYLTYMGKAGSQPWVKNRIQSGLIGFNRVMIQKPKIQPFYSGCVGQTITLGEDSIPGYKYKWIRKKDGSIRTTAKINLKFAASETFTAIMTYKNLSCIADTFSVSAFIENLPKPYLARDTVLCNRNTWEITLPNIYQTVNWKQNKNTKIGNYFTTDTAGWVYVEATSSMACKYRDTLIIKSSSPKVSITGPLKLCPEMDSIFTAAPGFKTYLWNGLSSPSNSFRSKPGKINLTVQDTLGCTASDSFISILFFVKNAPKLEFRICPYDSVNISKPIGYIQWRMNNIDLPISIHLKPAAARTITYRDSSGCHADGSISIAKKDIPIFSLGKDTAVCIGNKARFYCKYNALNYNWNGTLTSSDYYETTIAETVWCKITNYEGCSNSDTAIITNNPSPRLYFPADTSICYGRDWFPFSADGNFHYINGNKSQNGKINSPGMYSFRLENAFGCVSEKLVNVKVISCVNGTSNFMGQHFKISPNPCQDKLWVALTTPQPVPFTISDLSGKILLIATLLDSKIVDISTLKPGVYIVSCGNYRMPIVKQ